MMSRQDLRVSTVAASLRRLPELAIACSTDKRSQAYAAGQRRAIARTVQHPAKATSVRHQLPTEFHKDIERAERAMLRLVTAALEKPPPTGSLH